MILFFWGITYCINQVGDYKNCQFDDRKNGQVDIYIPLSYTASMYSLKGAVPISKLQYFSSDKSFKKINKYFNDMEEKKKAIEYELTLVVQKIMKYMQWSSIVLI